jgi:hypothetical protein
MAVEKKQVFKQNLKSFETFIQDTAPNSTYFKITELENTLTGGKNAFLIEGSDLLELGSEIKIEILDSSGNPIYTEAGDGYATSSIDTNGNAIITEYYEGVSKVVAIYVYTDTAYGPAQITILGEAKYYLDQNNIRQEIPSEWKGIYNVKWQRNLTINPSLANTTKVRFYKKPQANITEILSPIYRIESGSKVASNVTASFANIELTQLDTFAGDVKRVKVFRTSEGDISDYDLIQDIYIEAKELLTTYDTSGSVKGEAGILTSEALEKAWNTGSLNAYLTSSKIDNGCRLSGSGYFTYTGSLNLSSTNVYEFTIDAFYSASNNSDLGIYISGSNNGETLIATLNGTTPVKNLQNQLVSFRLDKTEETASLYLSQSQGEWHVGNLSLKLTEDTAFSPTEISFVTSMPTVIGNETYNFKFEFYDVNNNFVPVAVTQSATFTGGNNNVGGTLTLISGSTSALSQSVSYDLWFNPTGSITASIQYVSQSASSSLSFVSSSVSGTISNVSSSVSGTISLVSQSLSSSISTSLSQSYAYTDEISASNFLEFTDVNSRIFTDSTGLVSRTPSTGVSGLYLGQSYLGYHNGNGQVTGWKTYMSNTGNFFLTSSQTNGGYLVWDSAAATLQIKGAIDITGGTARTDIDNAALSASYAFDSASAYSSSLAEAISASSADAESISASTFFTTNLLDGRIFTDANGRIVKAPTASVAGLFLGSDHLGFYDSGVWRTYMDNLGKFYLTGSITDGYSNYLTWDGAGTLTVAGAINITGGTANDRINGVAASASAASASAFNASGSAFAADSKIFTDANGRIVKAPSTGVAGLFLGSSYLGYHDGSGTALGWKTYMANNGNFFLTGSTGGWLKWDSSAGTLDIKGSINITGGNAATTTDFTYALTNANTSSISTAQSTANNAATAAAYALTNANTGSINSLDTRIFNDAVGKINKTATPGTGTGLFLDQKKLGFYDGADWKTFMSSSGLFYLTGSAGGNALLWDGANLIIRGTIKVGDGSEVTSTTISNASTALQNGQTGKSLGLTGGSVGGVTIAPNSIYIGTGAWGNTNTGFYVDSGGFFSLKNKLTWDTNNLSVTGEITADSGQIGGWTIGGNKIFKTNKLELDAGATYPAINVYGSDNIPRVIINNSPTLSSLTGGGAGTGNVAAYSIGNSNSGVQKYANAISIPTVAGAVYNLTITFIEPDGNEICNFSPVTSTGNIITRMDIWDNGLNTQLQNVFYDTSDTIYNDTFWTWTDGGGIYNKTSTVNIVGDGTTLKLRPGIMYNGSTTTARSVVFPAYSYSYQQTVSKTEIIPGGMQVVNSTAAYLKADRTVTDSAGTPWMTSAGNWSHNGTLITTSDRNIKNNIVPIDFDLTKLNEIDGYSYNKSIDYDEDGNPDTIISTYGVIAQEIEQILPNAVSTNTNTGIKGVDYNAVTGMLVSAIKKLYLKINQLEAQISGSK